MKIKVRTAVPADAASLARVRMDTWRTSYRGLIPEATIAGMDIEKETARWTARLQAPPGDSFLYTAEIWEGEGGSLAQAPSVVGFCGGGPDRDADPEYSGELYAIYVLQAYQGKGVGRMLVQAAVDWLRQRGYGSMVIWVLRDNQPARRFYEVLGGKAVRERMIEIGGAQLPEVGYGYDLSLWVEKA